ncbi:hypothetical protein [Noviherbaspirillum sedimenti]|uniref:hypothetical protein n=1 Tax=Noviherbaspirillum sedimenti TaxID=2320865 RepID=UPI0011C38F43|nr:hypothetical protein [Noviherbaspirillum sedimenti]
MSALNNNGKHSRIMSEGGLDSGSGARDGTTGAAIARRFAAAGLQRHVERLIVSALMPGASERPPAWLLVN